MVDEPTKKATMTQELALDVLSRLMEKVRTEELSDLHVDGGQQSWCVTLTFPTKKG